MTNPSQGSPVTLAAAALEEWGRHVESILRGVAHSLNNRAAALSAVIELSADSGDDDAEGNRQILAAEMQKVQELVRTVRALGRPSDAAEAVMPSDVARDAESLLALHAELRQSSVSFDAASAPPVRVPRWMLLRALVALGASLRPAQGNRGVELEIVVDADWCVARARRAATPADGARTSICMAELARAMGGEPLADGSGFRVPTLEALRRREGR